jgi:solute:Na+ symporter, SSS family
VSGLLGCAIAHVLGTAIPYAVYGIAASVVCLLIAHGVLKTKPGAGADDIAAKAVAK